MTAKTMNFPRFPIIDSVFVAAAAYFGGWMESVEACVDLSDAGVRLSLWAPEDAQDGHVTY
jgi:hypothetical protein